MLEHTAEDQTVLAQMCLATDLADIVLVADQRGEPVGYITGKLHPEVEKGDIGLVSVSAQARGIGIGSQLIHAILTWFATQHIKQVVVVTQGRNIAAQRLYQRFGFQTQIVQLWYHRWFR